jgi:pimeloyl-ACP methyl ester carboxylesterase
MDPIDRSCYAAATPPTILCLHSSGSSGSQWRVFAERMQDGFAILTPDFHGHGAGPQWRGAPADVVPADTARIVRIARQAAGPVHLVGHSYGGAVALRVALQHPELVVSVAVYEPVAMRVLFEEDPTAPAALEIARVAATMRREIDAGSPERAAQVFTDYWSHPGHWASLSPGHQAAIARRMPVIHDHFVSLFNDVVTRDDYARLARPVLYLTGSETTAAARRTTALLQRVLPQVEPVAMHALGHLGPITHPERVGLAIGHFLRRHVEAPLAEQRHAA